HRPAVRDRSPAWRATHRDGRAPIRPCRLACLSRHRKSTAWRPSSRPRERARVVDRYPWCRKRPTPRKWHLREREPIDALSEHGLRHDHRQGPFDFLAPCRAWNAVRAVFFPFFRLTAAATVLGSRHEAPRPIRIARLRHAPAATRPEDLRRT